jgi:hypothetical protein
LRSLSWQRIEKRKQKRLTKNRMALRTHELLRLTKTMAPIISWDDLLPAETWRLAEPMRPLKTKRICTPGPMASMSKLCKVERSTRAHVGNRHGQMDVPDDAPSAEQLRIWAESQAQKQAMAIDMLSANADKFKALSPAVSTATQVILANCLAGLRYVRLHRRWTMACKRWRMCWCRYSWNLGSTVSRLGLGAERHL